MQQNDNYTPLAWYQDLNMQNHRKSYAYGEPYTLHTPIYTLLPFQIVRQHSAATIQYVKLYNSEDELIADITTPMSESGLTISSGTDYDNIIYYPITPMTLNIGGGYYYAVMSDGVTTWYSELFYWGDVSNCVKIEWWDRENLELAAGEIKYINQYKNTVYLNTEIGKPDYTFEEEGENRDGYYFQTKQISEKVYKFTALAPEYLCDAMRLIRLSDYIRITDQLGNVYDCDTFLMSPKWQPQGNVASVECEFNTHTVVKKCGKGYTLQAYGDFNSDYNNDFNNIEDELQ